MACAMAVAEKMSTVVRDIFLQMVVE